MRPLLPLLAAALLAPAAAPAGAAVVAAPSPLPFDHTMVVRATGLAPGGRYLVGARAVGPVHTDCVASEAVWARATRRGTLTARLLTRPGWPVVWCTGSSYRVRVTPAGRHRAAGTAQVRIAG